MPSNRRMEVYMAGLLRGGLALVLAAGLLGALQVRALPGAGRVAAARPASADLQGQFLVATSELQDPRFIRTVVYVIHHDADGSMGVVVNRPLQTVPLASLLKDLGLDSQGVTGEVRVYYGGPVEPTRGFVLHTTDYSPEGSEVVQDSIAVTAQPEILRAIGTGTGPRKSLFALGYAGWAPGQLEAELQAGFWAVVPADEGLLFDEHSSTKWERAMARRIIQM